MDLNEGCQRTLGIILLSTLENVLLRLDRHADYAVVL